MKNLVSLFFFTLVLQIYSYGQEARDNQQSYCQEIITNPYRSDGFGAQFQCIIFTALYAELHNKKFLYTPFKAMEHNYDNDENFLEKKETLINFINNFEINNDPTIQPTEIIHEYYNFIHNNLDLCEKSILLKKAKEIFRINKNKATYFDNQKLNIAIHIRRPNPHDTRIEGTELSNEFYFKSIQFLRSLYSSKNPLFHIYSQGSIDTFYTHFNSSDIVLHLNESIEDTFSSMVLADVLVTSTSSLSYTAGFLSEGIVYYIPFWHPPMPKWIILNPDF